MKNISIAIDGPSGAGKSTIAKILADRLSYHYLDTGAMYRAITWYCLDRSLNLEDEEEVCAALTEVLLEINRERVLVNGEDVRSEIRSQEITDRVSLVSSYRCVRHFLVDKQRELAQGMNIVLDGRDIGTVVLPEAQVKFYLTASLDARAQRRLQDPKNRSAYSYEEIRKDLERRDYFDSHRKESPLKQAEDAILIDSTDMSIDEVVDRMIGEWERVRCSIE